MWASSVKSFVNELTDGAPCGAISLNVEVLQSQPSDLEGDLGRCKAAGWGVNNQVPQPVIDHACVGCIRQSSPHTACRTAKPQDCCLLQAWAPAVPQQPLALHIARGAGGLQRHQP